MQVSDSLRFGRYRSLAYAMLLSSGSWSATALAQSAAAPPPSSPGSQPLSPETTPPTASAGQSASDGVQDIVVTAQRREQRLQDVPIAVTAVTQSALLANRVQNVSDLSGLAPNVQVRPAAGGVSIPSFSSRGIVSYGVVPGSDKEFSIYLDGVYIGATAGSIFELPDIERIEILRGPQGTLFGRNSTTGAASIVTRDPTGKFGGRQVFSVGNYNDFRTQTSIDLPAVGPFSAYVSFVHEDRDGEIRNTGAGTVWDRSGPSTNLGVQSSPSRLGGKNVESYFGALKFQPTNDFRMVYKFDHSNNRFTPAGQAVIGINPNAAPGGVPVGAFLAALVASQPDPVQFDTSAKRPDSVNNSFSVSSFQRVTGHNLTSTLQLGDHLTAKNIASYRKSFITSENQIDGLGGLVVTQASLPAFANVAAAQTGLPASLLLPFLQPFVGNRFIGIASQAQVQSKQYSFEQQFNYTSQLMDVTVGGLYYHEQTRSGSPRGLANNLNFAFLPVTGEVPLADQTASTPVSESTSYNKVTSIAAYAQAEVHVTDKLDVVAGGRVTHDRKSGTFVSGGTYVPGPSGGRTDGTFVDEIFQSFRYHVTKPTYSIGLNYKPSRDLLVYGKYSTGFVSGGKVADVGFSPETVRSAEGGVKAELLDRKLITNLALFYARYKNVQAAQGGPQIGRNDLGTVVITQGNVKAKGFEFESTLLPLRGVQLGASLGYTDVNFGTVNPLLVNFAGGRFVPTLIPKFTSNLSAQYESQPLFGDARFFARVDGLWRDKQRTLPNPDRGQQIPEFAPLQISPSAWVVNARVALREIGPMHAEVALWARNLNNNRSTLFPLELGGIIASSTFQPARTYGLDIGVRF